MMLERRRGTIAQGDDDGLFAYWNAADNLSNSIWKDRINNLAIRIGSSNTHGDGYYSITKTGNSVTGSMQIQSDVSSFIDYNFVVRIDCDIQTISGYGVYVLSYGSLITTKWSYAFSAGVNSANVVLCSAKDKNNTVITHDVDGVLTSWDTDGWNNDVVIKTGVYLKDNDKQRAFTSVNDILTETIDLTKVKLVPILNTSQYGVVGSGEAGANYLTNYRYVLHIKSIKMYNKI